VKAPLRRWEFWLGIIPTFIAAVAAPLVSVWQARDAQRARSATIIKDLTTAEDQFFYQLEAQAAMYLEIEICQEGEAKEPDTCWTKSYAFNPDAYEQRWTALEAQITYAESLADSSDEKEALKSLASLEAEHEARINALFATAQPNQAAQLSDRVARTKADLRIRSQKIREILGLGS